MIPQYEIRIRWSAEDRLYLVEVPDLPGCMADGKTRHQALKNAEVVIRQWIDAARSIGRPIPAKTKEFRSALRETLASHGPALAMLADASSLSTSKSRKSSRSTKR
jgi:predicted RNase H-like HicB family nuclease